MNAGKFARQRALIEADRRRTPAWRKKALARLVAEAGAEQINTGKRLISYKMDGGKYVCVKQRFKTEEKATETIEMIFHEGSERAKKPSRAYFCNWCHGWHLTSEALHAIT